MNDTAPEPDLAATGLAVRAAHQALCDAMVRADVAALDELLTDTCTLTHMTGYAQPKAEWLAEIDAEQMNYHSVDTVEQAVACDGGMAVLTARTLTDATIWGTRAMWRLQLRTWYQATEHGWIAARTVASTW